MAQARGVAISQPLPSRVWVIHKGELDLAVHWDAAFPAPILKRRQAFGLGLMSYRAAITNRRAARHTSHCPPPTRGRPQDSARATNVVPDERPLAENEQWAAAASGIEVQLTSW